MTIPSLAHVLGRALALDDDGEFADLDAMVGWVMTQRHGYDVLELIAATAPAVWDVEAVVDNDIPVVIIDTTDDPLLGPSVLILDRDGAMVQLHASRVAPCTHLPFYHPARRDW